MEENKETIMLCTRYEAMRLNEFLSGVRGMGKIDADDRVNIVMLKISLSDIVESFENFKKVSTESLLTKDISELSDIEKEEVDNKFKEMVLPYVNEQIELQYTPISKESFKLLIHDLNIDEVGLYEYFYKKLVKIN